MSTKKRIKQNFYMIDGYEFCRITKDDRAAMTDEGEREYWSDKYYWNVFRCLPDGRLYAGWSFQYPTKLTADDLPDDYILLRGYKKHGYIRTAGVVDLVYKPSPFHNHAFKDDFLYISYTDPLGEYKPGWTGDSTFAKCDEYIFDNDIVDFIFAVEKNSPDFDVGQIKRQMTEQYNMYCDEMNGWGKILNHEKIEKLEDLL